MKGFLDRGSWPGLGGIAGTDGPTTISESGGYNPPDDESFDPQIFFDQELAPHGDSALMPPRVLELKRFADAHH